MSVSLSWPRAMPKTAMIATAAHATAPNTLVNPSSSCCSGDFERWTAVTMSAMRPISVVAPVWVTTIVAAPLVTCVFWNTRSVRSEVDDLRTKLRADVASGVAVAPASGRELADRVGHGVALHDERRRLGARLSEPPAIPGSDDHLRHRRLPVPPAPRGRRRLLAIWSAVSTPLILALVGMAFLPGEITVIGLAAVGIVVVFVIEAIARGNLFRFLATLVSLVALTVVGTTVAGLPCSSGGRRPSQSASSRWRSC